MPESNSERSRNTSDSQDDTAGPGRNDNDENDRHDDTHDKNAPEQDPLASSEFD
jgi:hypothetical protein